MAKVEIDAGVCGFHTEVEAVSDDGQAVRLAIRSDCPHVMKMARALEEAGELDAYAEIFTAFGKNKVTEAAVHLTHVVCVVPSGVLKAIEVACELALPRDVHLAIGK
jgi:hypothetical protein